MICHRATTVLFTSIVHCAMPMDDDTALIMAGWFSSRHQSLKNPKQIKNLFTGGGYGVCVLYLSFGLCERLMELSSGTKI